MVNAVNTLEPQVQLDLLRLMALTNSMSDRREYVTYIEAADPRIMANEVAKVLDAAVQKGVISTGDEYYGEVKRVVDERAPADRAEAPKLAADGAQGRGRQAARRTPATSTSRSACIAEAEEMFQLALDKGGVDRDQTLTRLGIAQVQQGKLAEAKATFAQVAGSRAVVAQMWQAYVAEQSLTHRASGARKRRGRSPPSAAFFCRGRCRIALAWRRSSDSVALAGSSTGKH